MDIQKLKISWLTLVDNFGEALVEAIPGTAQEQSHDAN